MSLTVAKLGLALFRRIGILSFDPAQNATNQNRRGLCTGDTDEALIAINGAMEEVFSLGPIELSEQQQASVLRPATTVTVDVTNFSTTIANLSLNLSSTGSWAQGCTIRIPGDTRDNELISQTQLLRPYMGTTAAGVSSTVWGDAVPLASTVLTVLGPVEVPDQFMLTPVQGRTEWNVANGIDLSRNSNYQNFSSQAKIIGYPIYWMVETRNIATNAFTQRILRVTPMPDKAYSLSYRVKVKPPTYTLTDFYAGSTYGTDPGTIIPFDWAESTLLPIALQRFSSHPAFDLEQIPEVARQGGLARQVFAESAKAQSTPNNSCYAWRV